MSDEEDQTLGDFFAKKDKGKKPKKNKKKLKSLKAVDAQSSEVTSSKPQVEEWKDFEEEREKDYSSLKIQDLQIVDEAAKEEEVEEDVEDDIDGGSVEKQEKQSGIWNTSNAAPVSAEPVVPAISSSTNVVGGKYVPPALKRSTMGGASQIKRRQGAPPDIASKAMFPTLGAANEELGSSKTPSDFEMVKRGLKSNEMRVDDTRPNLNLGNRFNGLRS